MNGAPPDMWHPVPVTVSKVQSKKKTTTLTSFTSSTKWFCAKFGGLSFTFSTRTSTDSLTLKSSGISSVCVQTLITMEEKKKPHKLWLVIGFLADESRDATFECCTHRSGAGSAALDPNHQSRTGQRLTETHRTRFSVQSSFFLF